MLQKLEKYEIEEEIGHGGMASVYRAHDTVLDRQVALKVMHPHLRASEEARKRFHREAQSVARLRHPKVLEIYDFSGEGSSEAYIAAELLTGPTLKQWREDNQDIPAEIAACVVIEITKALGAAHEAKIVHRDVKPENVLLHEARTLKLTDFGIADMIDAQSMTATGQILGSPGHMAPEQIEGRETDGRTDLFSLGTVLYYLATGRLPFTGRNPHQVLKRIMDSEYADPLRVNPAIGGRVRQIIVKSLQRDPEARYQSAAELREDLEKFIAEAGIEDSEVMLARYLQDPEVVGAKLVEDSIDRLIDRGARASDAGDVPTALDYYNRVLALDEGNERVMKLIERVGMDRRRRMILSAGAGLMAFGLVASGLAYAVWSSEPEPDGPEPPVTLTTEDASVSVAEVTPDAASSTPDAALAQVENDAGAAESSTRPVIPATRARRVVELVPDVADVLISVDGAPAVPPRELRGLQLSVGLHRAMVSPRAALSAQYLESGQSFRVVRGSGPQRVDLTLRPKNAGLDVHCDPADASVTITGGRDRALIRECVDSPFFVAIPRSPRSLRVSVSAPGYVTRTVIQTVHGGRTSPVRVSLEHERAEAP